MITALALYSGRVLSEFELVGMTTNPSVIKQVLEILTKNDSHLVPTRNEPRHEPRLLLMPDSVPPEPTHDR